MIFSQIGRYKEALDFAMKAHQLDPSDSRLSEHVAQIRVKINAGTSSAPSNFQLCLIHGI